MCNNVYKWFLRAFAVVAALTVISCADSPDEDDVVIPQCSLSIDGTTVDEGGAAIMTFDENGGTKQFSIQTTGEWEIMDLENAPQNFALTTSKGEEKYKGKGNETFTVTLGESTTSSEIKLKIKVYASIFGQQQVANTLTLQIVQTKGGVMPEGKVIYANNFDKEAATKTDNKWPYIDQFEGWKNQEGEGATNVTYEGSGVSVRTSGKLSDDSGYSNYAGSGVNNIFFGTNGTLTIGNIAVSVTDLCLTFGTERYLQDQDNTFKNEEFLVTLSADGQSWSAPIAYSFPDGNDTNGKWNLATANFTLPEGTSTLYIKFASTLASAHRIDDVKLTDGFGGQAITFDGGGDQPDQPTPPTPGDAIYTNNFDKEAATKTDNKWPYIDQFEGWKNESGSGTSAVTYEGSGVSVRTSGKLSDDSGYSNYAGSGVNNIFFGTNGVLTIGNIALTSNKLCLTFGTERYLQDQDNTFKNEEFLVTLSADGQSWSKPIAYSFPEGNDTNGKWNLATANFTLPEGTSTLYIKFASTIASAHRLDDVTLTSGNGGQEITFEGGGETPTPPTPGDAIYTNNFDKEAATKTDNKWPYIDQFEGWKNESGSGASAVTYEGSGVSVRTSGKLSDDSGYSNYAGSGVNNIFFGTNGVLTIGNIALTSNKLCLTFGTERYLQNQDNTFKNEEFLVTLSADGQSWSAPITYAFEAGKDTNGKWNLATADFTLPDGTSTLYIKFASTITSAHRIDDVTLTSGNGGQTITFEGGGEPDQPTPPTPSDAIYTNNFDKEAATKTDNKWPYTDQFEGWKNESGSGASAVTYEGSGVSVRTSGKLSDDSGYSNYAGSGVNNIFFGTNGVLTIGNIALTSNKLCLTFGTERYLQGQDNTFKNEEFLVTLSADGQSWSAPITYAFEAGNDTNGKWNLATADFTLPGGTSTLYIKFASTITSAHRIDDVTLTDGNGGQTITFEGGGEQPNPNPDPDPDQPVVGNTASLTLEDIKANGPRSSYQDFSITAADGSVWTGFCSGSASYLQMGWKTDTTAPASKSYVLVPNADKVIKTITFTPDSKTYVDRVLALLPEDFEYTGQSADEVKAAAYACSANTVQGSTEPISIDLTGKNLKRFIIRAVGGAVYLTNITIEYAE